MNEDIVPGLLTIIQSDFEESYGKSEVVATAFESLQSKQATYKTVNELAIEVGDILSKALGASLSADKLPDGKMYYNISKRLLEGVLGRNFDIVSGYARDVQQLLNENAGLGLKAQVPVLNQDKIDGLVNRLSTAADFDSVKWLIGDPIVTFTQGIVDDTIQENVEFHAKVGLSPKITRTHVGNCCDWCRGLAGIYTYPQVPKDVYRRHGNCRCQTDYRTVDGRAKDIWSKIWRKKEKRKQSEVRIDLAKLKNLKENVERLDLTKASPNDIIELGKRINKHFDIAGNIGNKEKLKEIFSNFREIGGVVPKESWAKGSSRVIKEQLEHAFSYYPKEWSLIPKNNNRLLQAKKIRRGYFQSSDDPLVIAADGVRKTTPFHEIGHMVEWANPHLVRLEKEWVDQRTFGEKQTRLKDIFPLANYKTYEVTKKDNFIDPYIGKYYRDAAEVFTMGLQGIFVPEELFLKSFDRKTWKYEKKTIKDDPEFLNFIIGLFVKV